MFFLGILSIVLLVADYHFKQMESVRSALSTLVAPIQIVVDMPSRAWNWANRISAGYEVLHEENAELKAQSLVLQRNRCQIQSAGNVSSAEQQLINSQTADDRPYQGNRPLAT